MADDYMDAMSPCEHCGGERWAGSRHICPRREFTSLHAANAARQQLWGGKSQGPLYRATELAGEVGEICNVVKKLERERLGLVGSRATQEQLEDELGDGLICLSLLALEYGVDLDAVAARKFNKTSAKLSFPIFMVTP